MLDLTGYKLTFSEEFNTRSISQTGQGTTWADIRSQWRYDANSDIGFGHSSFVDPASGYDPFNVQGGALSITAVSDRTKYGYPGSWESGLITTQGNFSQTYGYFEMRADLADAKGGWDAFWLLPNAPAANPNKLPGWQELDVVEHYGAYNQGTYRWIHTTDPELNKNSNANLQSFSNNPAQVSGYHTYGMDWQKDKISFYFDGQLMGSRPTPSDMHGPMYLLANLATQADADQAGVPITMKIDYIRAYSNNLSAGAVAQGVVSAPDGQDPGLYGATASRSSSAPPTIGTAHQDQPSASVALRGTPGSTSKFSVPDGSKGVARYDAKGVIASLQLTALDGSTEVQTYTNGALTNDVVRFAPGGLESSETKVFNASGTLTSITRIHADKTKDVIFSNITGKGFATEHNRYDKSGAMVESTRTHADGSLDYHYALVSGGAKNIDQYDAEGALVLHAVTESDGSSKTQSYTKGILTSDVVRFVPGGLEASETKLFNSNGLLTSITQVHSNGTKDVLLSNIIGKNFIAEHSSYDEFGVMHESTRTHFDGSLDYNFVLDDNGSKIIDQYNLNGALVSHAVTRIDGSSETQTYSNGVLTNNFTRFAPGGLESSESKAFNSSGMLTSVTKIHSDKSKDVFISNITGKAVVAEHDSYDISGKLEFTDQTTLTGSHSQTAYQVGQSLVSTAGVTDNFKSFGHDTFVFASGFGKDTIVGFHAGSGSGHDVLQLDSAQIANFSNIHSHLTSIGADTLLTLSSTDSVLMKNVQVSALTAANFEFQDHGLFHL